MNKIEVKFQNVPSPSNQIHQRLYHFFFFFSLQIKDDPILKNDKNTLTDSQRIFQRANERHQEAMALQGKAADRFCKILTLEDVPLFLFLTSGTTC